MAFPFVAAGAAGVNQKDPLMKLAFLAVPVLVAFGSTAFAAEGTSGDATFPAACNPDLQKFCAGASTDEAKAECLAQNETKLSQACRTAVESGSQTAEEQPHGY
jgi:hypothetical protein